MPGFLLAVIRHVGASGPDLPGWPAAPWLDTHSSFLLPSNSPSARTHRYLGPHEPTSSRVPPDLPRTSLVHRTGPGRCLVGRARLCRFGRIRRQEESKWGRWGVLWPGGSTSKGTEARASRAYMGSSRRQGGELAQIPEPFQQRPRSDSAPSPPQPWTPGLHFRGPSSSPPPWDSSVQA